jgi:sulfate adenylyltransferase subunit 1 (EFTu-like GTPase family)
VYLLKQGTRTVTAEVNHALVLNQIGDGAGLDRRPIVFDRYVENRGTGSFILIDPATQFTCGAGMITDRFARPAPAGGAVDVCGAARAHGAARILG